MKRLFLNNLFSYSISTRFFIVVLPVLIIGFSLTTFLVKDKIEDVLYQRVRTSLLSDAKRIMEVADSEFASRYADLGVIAKNHELDRLVENGKFDETFVTLKEYKKALKVYSAIEIYDVDGILRSSSSRQHFRHVTKKDTASRAGETWFERAVSGGSGHTPVEKSEQFNSHVINFFAPIASEEGKIFGVLRLVYHTKYIFGNIQNYERIARENGDETKRFVLVSRNGTILYHSDSSKILTTNFDFTLPMTEAHSTSGFFSSLEGKGRDWIGAYSREHGYRFKKNLNWMALAVQEEEEAFADLEALTTVLYWIGLLTSLAVLLVLVLANRLISRPLAELNESIREIIKTKAFKERLQVKSRDEVGSLISSFNEMSEQMEDAVVSKNFFDSVFMGLTDFVFVLDVDGKISMVNDLACFHLRYERKELLGQSISSILTDENFGTVGKLKAMIARGELNEYDAMVSSKSKKEFPVILSGNYLHGEKGKLEGVILTARDARESRIIRELEEQKSLFESVIRNMGDGLLVSDRKGRELVLNDPAKRIIGLKIDDGTAWEKAVSIFGEWDGGEDEVLDIYPLARALNGEEVNNQEISLRSNTSAEDSHLSCTARPIRDKHGEVTAGIVVFRDITSIKEAEAELEGARVQLIQSEKLAALGLMSGGIAHEINNPLAIIISCCEFMRDLAEEGELEKDMVIENLDQVIETSFRITQIVKGLKTISRDSKDDDFMAVNLDEIVTDTLALCREKLKNAEIDLSVNLSKEELKKVSLECRPSQLAQVLMNLVSNAIDAMNDISADRWVKVEILDKEEQVVIKVADSGPGIPEDIRKKILLPFFTTKEVGKGTGLGLSISQSIIESHKGKIELDPGEQTCFIVSLPKKQSGDDGVAA